MGSDRIKIFRITDYMTAMQIVTHPAIKDVLVEDDQAQWIPDILNEHWLGILYDEELAGCFRVQQCSKILFQAHIYFIPGFRRHALLSTVHAMEWVLENLKHLELMICMIPECFENVIEFAKKCGFSCCGYFARSYLRKGEIVGTNLLSITRNDVESFIKIERKKWEQYQPEQPR